MDNSEISFDAVLDIAKEAGLLEEHFAQPQYFFAWVYRSLLWEILSKFVPGRHNLKSSEYDLDAEGRIKEITLIVEFEQLDELETVLSFLQKRHGLIPTQLREMMNLIVAIYYAKKDVLFIGHDCMRMISHAEFVISESDEGGVLTDKIISQHAYQCMGLFHKLLEKMIEDVF